MLFRRDEIRVSAPEEGMGMEQPPPIAVAGDVRFAIGTKKSQLNELLGELRHNEHVHVPSLGKWSMHHVLKYILEQTGPADVWITSWTITEEPIRMILEHLERGEIRTLKALFSERVPAMNPKAHQLARFNLQVMLTKIHAKSIVVLNDKWGVTVGGSANFTRNPRIEKYILCTHRNVAEYERDWIDRLMAGAHPFDTK